MTGATGTTEVLNIKPLNYKQLRFIERLFENGFNQVQSYISVYSGVTYTSAEKLASKLMKKETVRNEIEKRKGYIREQEQIKKHVIVQQLNKLIEECSKTGDKKNLLKSIDILCKVGGLYQMQPLVNVQSESLKVSFGSWSPENTIGEGAIEVPYTEVQQEEEETEGDNE